jgi:hypothetical protein
MPMETGMALRGSELRVHVIAATMIALSLSSGGSSCRRPIFTPACISVDALDRLISDISDASRLDAELQRPLLLDPDPQDAALLRLVSDGSLAPSGALVGTAYNDPERIIRQRALQRLHLVP